MPALKGAAQHTFIAHSVPFDKIVILWISFSLLEGGLSLKVCIMKLHRRLHRLKIKNPQLFDFYDFE